MVWKILIWSLKAWFLQNMLKKFNVPLNKALYLVKDLPWKTALMKSEGENKIKAFTQFLLRKLLVLFWHVDKYFFRMDYTVFLLTKILNFYYPIKLNHHLNKDGHSAINVYRCPFMLSVLKDNLFYSKDLLKISSSFIAYLVQ